MYSRFALSDRCCDSAFLILRSGRQDLTALGTAAGKNLAAVGSCHSLTETVNLGTMTLARLIGTLHNLVHLLSKSLMLDSLIGRSNT